jgi:hypothetical protein
MVLSSLLTSWKMKILFTAVALFSPLILSRTQMQNPIPLWPAGAPGAFGTNAAPVLRGFKTGLI